MLINTPHPNPLPKGEGTHARKVHEFPSPFGRGIKGEGVRIVVVVGGGISGLACAYRLTELSRLNSIPIQLTLLEASSRLGGTIATVRHEDCLLELGPDAIFTEKPAALIFGKKIGLEKEWIGTNPNLRKSFVAFRFKLYPVPEGFYLLAPSKIFPMLISPLFSLKAKWRMLLEPFCPSKKSLDDESLASFVCRRFGREVLERIAQPMVGGIYSTPPEDLSLQATFPKFLEWERDFGSVIKGLAHIKRGSHSKSSGPRYSLFVTLKNGLGELIEKIEESLPKESIKLNSRLDKVQFDQSAKKFKIITNDNQTMEADALCLAVPTTASAKIVSDLNPSLSGELSKIEYRSCATINLIYREETFHSPLDGFGFVVPLTERKILSGCTYSSVKFSDRAPKDKVILRCFVGGEQYEKVRKLSDTELSKKVQEELTEILSVGTQPQTTFVYRHERSLPQYKVGHLKIVEKIREYERAISRFALCGNGISGTGIPDCIESGERAAEKIFSEMLPV